MWVMKPDLFGRTLPIQDQNWEGLERLDNDQKILLISKYRDKEVYFLGIENTGIDTFVAKVELNYNRAWKSGPIPLRINFSFDARENIEVWEVTFGTDTHRYNSKEYNYNKGALKKILREIIEWKFIEKVIQDRKDEENKLKRLDVQYATGKEVEDIIQCPACGSIYDGNNCNDCWYLEWKDDLFGIQETSNILEEKRILKYEKKVDREASKIVHTWRASVTIKEGKTIKDMLSVKMKVSWIEYTVKINPLLNKCIWSIERGRRVQVSKEIFLTIRAVAKKICANPSKYKLDHLKIFKH